MKTIIFFLFIGVLLYFTSCGEYATDISVPKTGLGKYLEDNIGFSISDELIACAASQPITEADYAQFPISVFFYPITGAYEFKYFECDDIDVEITDYDKFSEKVLTSDPIFNGFLRRFKNNTINQDVFGIVTYKVDKVIHLCKAIRIKHYSKPTQFASELITVTDSVTFPRFDWNDGVIAENAIYFQVVSDSLDNLISGTYTFDKYFRFYDLSNVVLNIRDVNPEPTLDASTKYNFMLMSVSQDNWVNLIGAKSFYTQ